MHKDANEAIKTAIRIAKAELDDIHKEMLAGDKLPSPLPAHVANEMLALHQVSHNADVIMGTDNVRPDFNLCKCGTCQEAAKAAMRLYSQLRENHCRYWVLQIATTMIEACTLESGDEIYNMAKRFPERYEHLTDDQMAEAAGLSAAVAHIWSGVFIRVFQVVLTENFTDDILDQMGEDSPKYC